MRRTPDITSGLVSRTLLFCAMALAATATARGADREASSIAEFVAAKDRWNRMVGQPMRLEGRYTIYTARELRFLNCDLSFVLTRSFRRRSNATKNVEVSGQLIRKDGGLEFRVTDLKPRESDDDLLKHKRSLVNSSNPDEVYELAAWARQRGKFYEDEELITHADRLYREGLRIAYEHLSAGDVAGLRELATKAREVGVEEGIAHEYLHEADRLEWESAQQADNKDYRGVIGRIQQDLTGAKTPLPADRLGIRDDYEKAPLVAYRLADAATRQWLARAFYLEVALANVLLSAEGDGRNGYQIAERMERDLPELSDLADEYRQRELKYLTARLRQLSRGQMVELSERYQARSDQAQATAVIRDWLKSQEPQAAAAGPTDLMELGDEYLNLLQDERGAGRMYKLAWQQNPQLETSAQWLSTHGYELTGNQWSKPGEVETDMPAADLNQAIAEGRVQVGMTGAQVLQALGTKPSTAMRMATAGEIAELWIFADYGISVRLQRRSTSRNAEVVAIGSVDGR